MIRHLLNLRPYSWVDLILLGYVAKCSVTRSLEFAADDLAFVGGLLGLWTFYNLALEARHHYPYRGRVSAAAPLIFLALAATIGLAVTPLTLVPVALSTGLVWAYLHKNENVGLGAASSLARGLIQACYLWYARMFFSTSLDAAAAALGLAVLLLYTARALVGDLRDVAHNREAGKRTFPVTFGVPVCTVVTVGLVLAAAGVLTGVFGSVQLTVPLLLTALPLALYKNGYVLHQLMIFATTYTHINVILFLTGGHLRFSNLVYAGVLLNMVCYPLLARRSNPQYVQPNEIGFR